MKCKSIEQNDFSFRKQQIKQHCEYGLEYFCDGTPNFSEVRRDAVKKPPCKYFRNHCPVQNSIGRNMVKNEKKGSEDLE